MSNLPKKIFVYAEIDFIECGKEAPWLFKKLEMSQIKIPPKYEPQPNQIPKEIKDRRYIFYREIGIFLSKKNKILVNNLYLG